MQKISVVRKPYSENGAYGVSISIQLKLCQLQSGI